jgi:hypothetical protein
MNHPTYPLYVSIDKLASGLPINVLKKGERKVIGRNLREVVASYKGTPLSTKGKAYRRRYRIPLDDDNNQLILEYHPNRPDKALYALRFEFNPNKVGTAGCALVRSIIHELFGEDAFVLSAEILLLSADLCIDVHGVSVADVIVHVGDKQSFSTWGKNFGKDAELETLYLGSPKSDHQVRCYDKQRELLSALVKDRPNIKMHDLELESKAQGKRMRIEVSTKLNGLAPAQLCTLKNPFEGIEIFSLPQVEVEFDSDMGRLFIDSVKLNGSNVALRRIQDANLRRRYMRSVAKHRVDWWTPGVFADQVIHAFKALRVFSEAAFTLSKSEIGASVASAALKRQHMVGQGNLSRMRPLRGSERRAAKPGSHAPAR